MNIYHHTTNITNIYVGNKYGVHNSGSFRGVKAGGPPLADVNAHSAHPVRTVHLTSAGGAGRSQINGNSLAIYAPHMNRGTGRQARPPQVARNIGHANLKGYGAGASRNSARTTGSGYQPMTNGNQRPTTHIGTTTQTHHHSTGTGSMGESGGYNRPSNNTSTDRSSNERSGGYTHSNGNTEYGGASPG